MKKWDWLYYDKLMRMEPEERKSKYALAVLAEEQDEVEQTNRMMNQLAPANETGYGPAHYWLATERLKKKEKTAEDLEYVRTHLLRAVDDQPDHADAHTVLNQIYLLRRDTKRAAEHLALAVNRRPQQRFGLALLYARLGQKSRTDEQARLAADYWREMAAKSPGNIEARLKWAQAEVFLQDHASALAILREGMKNHKDTRYRRAMAGVLASWSDRIPAADLARKLELLRRTINSQALIGR